MLKSWVLFEVATKMLGYGLTALAIQFEILNFWADEEDRTYNISEVFTLGAIIVIISTTLHLIFAPNSPGPYQVFFLLFFFFL